MHYKYARLYHIYYTSFFKRNKIKTLLNQGHGLQTVTQGRQEQIDLERVVFSLKKSSVEQKPAIYQGMYLFVELSMTFTY